MDNRMTKSGSERNLGTYWHSDPHTGTPSRMQPHVTRSASN